MEKKTGLHSALSSPRFYNLFQRLVGADKVRRRVVAEFIRPRSGDTLLDIGCGTGEWYPLLGQVDYHGFDCCKEYILHAKHNHPTGRFTCEFIGEHARGSSRLFDIVLSIGVIHHLDNREASRLFETALNSLKPGGRLITLDPCYDTRQSWLSEWVIRRDRGKNIRLKKEYVALADVGYAAVKPTLWLTPLRIPYTYCILECQK